MTSHISTFFIAELAENEGDAHNVYSFGHSVSFLNYFYVFSCWAFAVPHLFFLGNTWEHWCTVQLDQASLLTDEIHHDLKMEKKTEKHRVILGQLAVHYRAEQRHYKQRQNLDVKKASVDCLLSDLTFVWLLLVS